MKGCPTYTDEPGRGTSRDWYSGVGSKLYPFPYNFTFGQIIGPALSDEPTQFGSQRRLNYKDVWHPLPSLFPDVLQCQGQKCGGHIVPHEVHHKISYISVTVVKFLIAHNCGTFFLFTINCKQSRWTTAVPGWWEKVLKYKTICKASVCAYGCSKVIMVLPPVVLPSQTPHFQQRVLEILSLPSRPLHRSCMTVESKVYRRSIVTWRPEWLAVHSMLLINVSDAQTSQNRSFTNFHLNSP